MLRLYLTLVDNFHEYIPCDIITKIGFTCLYRYSIMLKRKNNKADSQKDVALLYPLEVV